MKIIMKSILTLTILTALTINLQAQEKSSTPVKKETTATQPVKAQPAQAQVKAVKPTETNPFAGKTFNVIIKAVGQADENKDLLTFDKVNFHSRWFSKKGFAAGAYTNTVNAETNIFEATSSSVTEGKLTWKGMLKGDKLTGTCILVKDKQEPVRYTFMGTVVPMVMEEKKTDGAKE